MNARAGVVGGGLMGLLHARVYQALSGVELAWVADADEERHARLQSALGVPVHSRPRWDQVDAVSVCTPDDVRGSVVYPALDAGVRVLVEKPLATNLAEARGLLDARPTPEHLMVGHLLRFDPRVEQAANLISDGAVGTLWSVRCWRANRRSIGRRVGQRVSVDWFLGIHDVDLVHAITGQEIAELRAQSWSKLTARRDLVNVWATLRDGTPVTFEWSWLLPDDRSGGLQAGLQVIGSEGMLEIDLSHSTLAVSSGKGTQQVDTFHWPPAVGAPGGDLRREIQTFVESVYGAGPVGVTGEKGMRAVAVIDAVETAVQTGGVEGMKDRSA